MDDAAQDKLVTEANAVGIAVKKITDQLRETEATNSALTDALHRADEEIARKDSIIADQAAKLDDALADLAGKHDALVSVGAIVRETFARQRGEPPAKKQIEHDMPMPRIVRQGPAS
jgi:hypothetical protein